MVYCLIFMWNVQLFQSLESRWRKKVQYELISHLLLLITTLLRQDICALCYKLFNCIPNGLNFIQFNQFMTYVRDNNFSHISQVDSMYLTFDKPNRGWVNLNDFTKVCFGLPFVIKWISNTRLKGFATVAPNISKRYSSGIFHLLDCNATGIVRVNFLSSLLLWKIFIFQC